MPTSATTSATTSVTSSVKGTDTNAYINSSANMLANPNDQSSANSPASISENIRSTYKDILDFLNKYIIPIFEKPLYALLEIFDKVAEILLKIFSNYDELENSCDVLPDVLLELSEHKENDKNLLKKQLSNVMIIPITVYIMYNWLFLSCFRERYLINENMDNTLYWFFYGASLEEKKKVNNEMRGLERENKKKEQAGEINEYEGEDEYEAEGVPEENAPVVEGQPIVVEGQPTVVEGQPIVVEGQPPVVEGQPPVIQGGQEQGEESLLRQQEMSHMKGGGLRNVSSRSYALPKRMKYGGMSEMSMADQMHMSSGMGSGMASNMGSSMGSLKDMKNISSDDIKNGLAKLGKNPGADKPGEEEEETDNPMDKSMDQINQVVPGASNIANTFMRWYTPVIHLFAGVSDLDIIIFGLISRFCEYFISPNLHPLLFYSLFFAFMFRYIKKYNDEFAKSITNWLDYVTSKAGSGVVLTVHPFIKKWTTFFLIMSFVFSIPKGINDFREYQNVYLFIFLSICFIISFSVIMAKLIDTACMLVIGYLIVYSYFGMMFFSKTSVFKTMYGMDVYFFKKIRDLANPNDKVLNILINSAFLFIFEIIVIIFLIHGIQQYLSNAEDMTIKVAMSLINGLLIYMVLKYCHYKFQNLFPRYMNDIKPGAYEDLMDNCFNGEIPIKSYASDKQSIYNTVKSVINTAKSDYKKGKKSAKYAFLGKDYPPTEDSQNMSPEQQSAQDAVEDLKDSKEEIGNSIDNINSKIEKLGNIPTVPATDAAPATAEQPTAEQPTT